MSDQHSELSIACGNCGGNLLMATCNHFRGTGHEWVLVSICMVCRGVHWTSDGCLDCKECNDCIGEIEFAEKVQEALDG